MNTEKEEGTGKKRGRERKREREATKVYKQNRTAFDWLRHNEMTHDSVAGTVNTQVFMTLLVMQCIQLHSHNLYFYQSLSHSSIQIYIYG